MVPSGNRLLNLRWSSSTSTNTIIRNSEAKISVGQFVYANALNEICTHVEGLVDKLFVMLGEGVCCRPYVVSVTGHGHAVILLITCCNAQSPAPRLSLRACMQTESPKHVLSFTCTVTFLSFPANMLTRFFFMPCESLYKEKK